MLDWDRARAKAADGAVDPERRGNGGGGLFGWLVGKSEASRSTVNRRDINGPRDMLTTRKGFARSCGYLFLGRWWWFPPRSHEGHHLFPAGGCSCLPVDENGRGGSIV